MKSKPVYKRIVFDSQDEIYAYQFLEQCVQAGYIDSFVYHPDSIEILPIVKEGRKTVFRNLSYTPDFLINGITLPVLRDMFRPTNSVYIIDVKPLINMRFNDQRYFSILQKIAWSKGMFINKFVCKTVFEQTFAPKDFIHTKKGKVRKGCESLITISQFKDLQK